MKRTYNTVQRAALLSFFKASGHTQFTIEQIYAAVKDKAKLGKSTVYRLVTQMVDDGTLIRFTPENNRHFVYQYVGCCSPKSHLHLKCTECGCLLHMENDKSEQILSELLKLQSFQLDGEKTMLYGKCKNCCAAERNIKK